MQYLLAVKVNILLRRKNTILHFIKIDFKMVASLLVKKYGVTSNLSPTKDNYNSQTYMTLLSQSTSVHWYWWYLCKHRQFSDEWPFGSLFPQSWNVSGDILVPLDTQVQVPSWSSSVPPIQMTDSVK